jgi:hypothetical protein
MMERWVIVRRYLCAGSKTPQPITPVFHVHRCRSEYWDACVLDKKKIPITGIPYFRHFILPLFRDPEGCK